MSYRMLALALFVLPGTLTSQAHPLAGEWTVVYAGGMRMENGEAVPLMQKGTLSIAEAGDSLVATLKSEPMEGMPARPPARMAAKRAVGKMVFVMRSEAKLNMNGEESVRTAISTFTLDASGDTMTGTLERSIEGMDMPSRGAQPVNGTRSKL